MTDLWFGIWVTVSVDFLEMSQFVVGNFKIANWIAWKRAVFGWLSFMIGMSISFGMLDGRWENGWVICSRAFVALHFTPEGCRLGDHSVIAAFIFFMTVLHTRNLLAS